MKLRLEKNMVRLRLSTEDIDILKSQKNIGEKISISKGNEFSFSIKLVDNRESCMMVFKTNTLDISIPNAVANKWMNTNQIGIKESIVTNDGRTIGLIVEEDLPPRKNK